MNVKDKRKQKLRRHRKVRAKVSGTEKRPRLCVFRSNKHIYAQLIDDQKNKVLVSESDLKLKIKKVKSSVIKAKTDEKTKKSKEKAFSPRLQIAFEIGKSIAKKAIALKITSIVFDRGGYKYHGKVKALAEGAREEGLKF
jgi:large subunit ribosomal protein L18